MVNSPKNKRETQPRFRRIRKNSLHPAALKLRINKKLDLVKKQSLPTKKLTTLAILNISFFTAADGVY